MPSASFISQWSFDVTDYGHWKTQLADVVSVLQSTAGFESLMLLHSPDEPQRYQVHCSWVDVGSYRRGVSSTQAKLVIWPFLTTMIDAPSSFETLLLATPAESVTFDTSVESP